MSTHALENPTVRKPLRFTLLSLTITLADVNSSTDPDRGEVRGGKNPQKAVGGSKQDWKTVSAAAKMLLYAARDTADAFPPLKSVTGGLCAILENYEVWFPSHI